MQIIIQTRIRVSCKIIYRSESYNIMYREFCMLTENTNILSDIKAEQKDATSAMQELRDSWKQEQEQLRESLILHDKFPWQHLQAVHGNVGDDRDVEPLKYVGGMDISFVKGCSEVACAAFIVVELPDRQVIHSDVSVVKLTAPYIPGFLAFREAPFLVEKVHQLRMTRPDILPQVIIVDGNGILHVRGFGLASHVGVLLDMPTIGVAKTLYHVDGIENNAAHKEKKEKFLERRGDHFDLVDNSGLTLGVAYRSTDVSTNPIYISQGHKISLDTAIWVVDQCCKYREPEPVRQADILSREHLRQKAKELPVCGCCGDHGGDQ